MYFLWQLSKLLQGELQLHDEWFVLQILEVFQESSVLRLAVRCVQVQVWSGQNLLHRGLRVWRQEQSSLLNWL